MATWIRNVCMVASAAALTLVTALWDAPQVAARDKGKGHDAKAPRFEVDASWPKTLPNNWVIGQTAGIAVDTRNPGIREERLEVMLDFLCSESGVLQIRRRALAARGRHADRVVAVMAPRPPTGARAVHRERHAAVRALERVAALPAEHAGRKSPAVEQHEHLFAR